MAADRVLPGYETYWGNKKVEIIEHFGPASYATGGETYTASQVGWGGFDRVSASISYSGTYQMRVLYGSTAVGAVASVKIMWVVIATGAEVAAAVNLSTEITRLELLGV